MIPKGFAPENGVKVFAIMEINTSGPATRIP